MIIPKITKKAQKHLLTNDGTQGWTAGAWACVLCCLHANLTHRLVAHLTWLHAQRSAWPPSAHDLPLSLVQRLCTQHQSKTTTNLS